VRLSDAQTNDDTETATSKDGQADRCGEMRVLVAPSIGCVYQRRRHIRLHAGRSGGR